MAIDANENPVVSVVGPFLNATHVSLHLNSFNQRLCSTALLLKVKPRLPAKGHLKIIFFILRPSLVKIINTGTLARTDKRSVMIEIPVM
jgi:hypothetical protein